MSKIEFHYTLHRIKSGRQESSLLARALLVYQTATPKLEATSSKEIEYWSDLYNEQFDDELFIFALQENEDIVGFAQCVLFSDEGFIILDYMTVSEKRMTVGLFFMFFEQIKYYFQLNEIYYDFVVAELLKSDKSNLTESSIFWKTTMALEGFRLIEGKYVQLQLGVKKFETRVGAHLLISVDKEASSIRRETYMMLIETILFKHYLRWYEPFMSDEEFRDYSDDAKKVFTSIKSELENTPQLNLSTIDDLPLPSGSIHTSYKANSRLIAYETISYLIIFIIILAAKFILNLGATEVVLLAVVALLVRMALLSIFVKEAKESLLISIETLKFLLGNKNSITRYKPKKSRNNKRPVNK